MYFLFLSVSIKKIKAVVSFKKGHLTVTNPVDHSVLVIEFYGTFCVDTSCLDAVEYCWQGNEYCY